MLRINVTVEIVPFGIESLKRTLGTMKIWNDGTGNPAIGNYGYSISKIGKAIGQTWRTGEIKNFPRKKLNAWMLLFLVLKNAIENGGNNDYEES